MNFKKITASALLLAGIAVSPHALAAQSFDGHTVNVAFEMWNSDDVLGGGDDVLFNLVNKKDVLASDSVYPDETDFYVFSAETDRFYWDIDFSQNMIELTYTSIDNYYISWKRPSVGFHFQDSENSLPDIINVIVDTAFAPTGFYPESVTFDADNIYVNFNGSTCFMYFMGHSPECANSDSPTGYNNRIKLTVEFAAVDEETINELYDWLESKYPEYLPTHQDSFHIKGYYARFYQVTDAYIGSLEGSLYVYGTLSFGGLLELGDAKPLGKGNEKGNEN